MSLFVYNIVQKLFNFKVYEMIKLIHFRYSSTVQYCSGGGPIHARVPIHAHPQFS